MHPTCAWNPNTDIQPVRSAPSVMGYGAALSVVLAAFTYTGGKLTGYERDPSVDEVSRKEYLRKNRRRPVEQIVNELGEGRGMHGRLEHALVDLRCDVLTFMQVSPRPATRSAGHSASRPTTALTCPLLLRRRYVSYTHQYQFLMFIEAPVRLVAVITVEFSYTEQEQLHLETELTVHTIDRN